jgi:hypothetical protein
MIVASLPFSLPLIVHEPPKVRRRKAHYVCAARTILKILRRYPGYLAKQKYSSSPSINPEGSPWRGGESSMLTLKNVSPHWSVEQSEAEQLPSAKGRSKSADIGGSPPVAPQKNGAQISASVSAGQSLSSRSSSDAHRTAESPSLSLQDKRRKR